jgi:GDP-D-mannose dehydratase
MAPHALLTGITCPDGSNVAEFLLDNGCEAHSLIPDSSQFNTGRIDHLCDDPHEGQLEETTEGQMLPKPGDYVTALWEMPGDREVREVASTVDLCGAFAAPMESR